MKHYRIDLKCDKDQIVTFAQGESGEILYISAFMGRNPPVAIYLAVRDRILNDDDHLKRPQEYMTLKTVDQAEAMAMFGFPEITPAVAAANDLRQGIRVVTERAAKELRG